MLSSARNGSRPSGSEQSPEAEGQPFRRTRNGGPLCAPRYQAPEVAPRARCPALGPRVLRPGKARAESIPEARRPPRHSLRRSSSHLCRSYHHVHRISAACPCSRMREIWGTHVELETPREDNSCIIPPRQTGRRLPDGQIGTNKHSQALTLTAHYESSAKLKMETAREGAQTTWQVAPSTRSRHCISTGLATFPWPLLVGRPAVKAGGQRFSEVALRGPTPPTR